MSDDQPSQTQAAEDFVFNADWYENQELENLPRLLAGARLFVDVGASIGPYTRKACAAMQGGEVVAIEANPDSFRRLESHGREWEKEFGSRVRCVHAAAADREGTIDFFIPQSELPLISGVFQNTAAADDWQKVTVPCVTLDQVLAGQRPDLVKVDVEGAECRVLLGAGRLVKEGCRFLVEIHPWGDPEFQKTPVDVFRFFYERGYDFDRVARHWHFYPAPASLKRALKFHAMSVIQRNAGLKDVLKRLVLKLDAWRGK